MPFCQRVLLLFSRATAHIKNQNTSFAAMSHGPGMVWQSISYMSKCSCDHVKVAGTPSLTQSPRDSRPKKIKIQGGGVAFKDAPSPRHIGRLPRSPNLPQVVLRCLEDRDGRVYRHSQVREVVGLPLEQDLSRLTTTQCYHPKMCLFQSRSIMHSRTFR